MIGNVDWFFISHRLHLVRGARDAGFDVFVAVSSTGRIAEIESAGAEVVELDMSRSGTSLAMEVRSAFQIRRAIQQVRPDVVHLIGIKPIVYGSLATLLSVPRPQVVAAFSGFGHLLDGESRSSTRRAVIFALRLLLRANRATVVVQNEVAGRELEGWGVCHRGEWLLIEGSGVDTAVFAPASKEPTHEPVVLMSGRLIGEKGVAEYLDACAMCKDLTGLGRYMLAGIPDIGGNPTAWSVEEAQERAAKAGVELLLNVDDMASLLARSDIFVHASYTEGLSKSLLEAAAAGLAIVATDIAGNRPVVTHGETGLLVPVRDSRALAAGIAQLMMSVELRRSLGAAARQRTVERFSAEKIRAETVSLWSSLAGR